MSPLLPRTLHRRDGGSGQELIIAVVVAVVILLALVLLAKCCITRPKQNPAATQPNVGRRVEATPGQLNRVGVGQEVDTVRRMEPSLGRSGLRGGEAYALAEIRRSNVESERGEREGAERERERERLAVDDAPPPPYEEARKQPRVDV